MTWVRTTLVAVGLGLAPCTSGCTDRANGGGDHDAAGDDADGLPEDCVEDGDALTPCISATDEASCVAVNDEVRLTCDRIYHICVWRTRVPTTVSADGTCSFGPLEGSCETDTVHADQDGCADSSGALCGEHMPEVTYVRAGAEILLERGRFCLAPNERCVVDADGVVGEGLPPECACACDPSFPD